MIFKRLAKKKNKNKNETDRSRTRTHRISWCHIFPQNIVIRKWIIKIGGFTVEQKDYHLLTHETIFLKLVSDITRLVQEAHATSQEANEATRIFLNHDLPQKRDWLWFCSWLVRKIVRDLWANHRGKWIRRCSIECRKPKPNQLQPSGRRKENITRSQL